jgi:hypothetical protein
VQVAAHDVAGAHDYQRCGQEVLDGNRRPGSQRVVRTHAGNRPAGEQRRVLQIRRHVVPFQVVHQAEVDAPLEQGTLDIGVQAADHLDRSRRVLPAELLDDGHHQRDRGGIHRGDPDHAAALVLLAGRAAQPVHGVEDGHDVRQEITARLAHPGAVPPAFEHVDTQLPLQCPHGLTQGRLGDIDRLRRFTEGT